MIKKLLLPAILLILVVGYFLGPKPETPNYKGSLPELNVSISEITQYVDSTENSQELRVDNNAKIVWELGIGKPTEYVILYLPGFSATRMEGNPVHIDMADKYACNLYLARLDYHGYKESQLADFTAEGIWESALEQFAIAEKLGQKVIIMGTSTGATLGIMLAAKFPDKVHGLINMSPNIRVNNSAAFLLNDPWGLQICNIAFGGEAERIYHDQEAANLYWDTLYPATAVVQLQELLETSMVDSTFQKVKCPTITLYYYKNEANQDEVVDVSYIPKMQDKLGTPANLKRIKAIPTAGNHVIGSFIKSKDYQAVEAEISSFIEDIYGLKPWPTHE
ncbi:hypothetical protein Oweho_3524 [Owenweeksia hongkongensis DSM 17368]|uniref:Hydrolase or acyltransferase of alpha/beta superfamily n=1 Tax=Owenweeksia hongkongensis (strain DSM 17368 / CIP 108786 / JCM 12287 / NRRL B-23963 / UST20020801) TaxID=926562 RepID=G8R765_OWEHD|nr:alpha/beta hydrolase [Owenweeksia hongkongensis]AEV34472.1 hypothetical protein Oweho_3524 [Owenweeksia hongkongensis DSM 17368]